MIRACAFDLGNTLSDDTTLYDLALGRFSRVLAARGLVRDPARFVEIYDAANRATSEPFTSHTFGEQQMFATAFERLDVSGMSPEEGLQQYRDIIMAETTLHSDIRDGLEWLGGHGIARAILSNERSGRVESWLAATGSRRLFEVVFVSEDSGVEKPNPEFFRLALQRIGVAPAEVLMFGDNTIADGACQVLGIPFVHVTAFSTDRWYFERGQSRRPEFEIPAISPESLRRTLLHFDPARTLP